MAVTNIWVQTSSRFRGILAFTLMLPWKPMQHPRVLYLNQWN